MWWVGAWVRGTCGSVKAAAESRVPRLKEHIVQLLMLMLILMLMLMLMLLLT